MNTATSTKPTSVESMRVNTTSKTTLPDSDLSGMDLLKLHQQLATTLKPSDLINRLFSWLSQYQLVSGIEYLEPLDNRTLISGSSKPHKAQYIIRLEDRYLGELTISNQKKFTEVDILAHEQAISCLIHHLKNALDYQALEKVAFHDSLTGVMNRTSMDELLPKEVGRAQRHCYDLSVVMVDIDNFKVINDEAGHLMGDHILRHVSRTIKNQLRTSDLLFRYGGDEFFLILPNTDLPGANKAAQQIINSMGRDFDKNLALTTAPKLSIGVTHYRPGEHHEELVYRVDSALYEAKKNGRNCIISKTAV
ncbi:GGDEF domain-containing protein [Porticoccus sp.]